MAADSMAQFKAVMISKHDEGLAAVREFIKRNGDDEISLYASRLIQEADTSDVDAHLRAQLAMLGLFHAWLSVLDESDEEK